MVLVALFLPEECAADTWRLRLLPLPLPRPVQGLDEDGECVFTGTPDYAILDRLMVNARSGYRRRAHSSGVVEVTTSTRDGALALSEWITLTLVRDP